ncbi:reverse transcriptase domain-containing protein [Tanacetum coccineum]
MTSEVGSSNGLLAPWLLTLEDGIPRPGLFFITSARCVPCSTTIMDPKKTITPMTDAAIKALIAQGVVDALAEYEMNRNSENGNDSHDSGSGRRTERATRECTYNDFLKCQPLNFKGTEFATCTLLGSALAWWNSHVRTVGHDAAYGMTWKTLRKMMTDKYCPRSEIKKLEIEICNLKVNGTDVVSYTTRFQELALMCSRMFPEESDEVEKNVGGLPHMIQGSVMASKQKTMQHAIEFANDLMDHVPLLRDRPKTRENSTTTQATTTHNNRLSRGKM